MIIKKLLPAAMLIAAAATPLTALASDQPGVAANAWKEEGTALGGTDPSDHTGDAGKFISGANMTRGAGPLELISGKLSHYRDVDLYCISITSPTSFSAVASAQSGTGNTILFLFDPAGHGVACNDDDPAGGIAPHLSNAFVTTPGTYYLGVSRISVGFGSVYQMAFNAGGTDMFPESPTNVQYGPINPADVLTSWKNSPVPGFGDIFDYNYTVTLTGAGFSTTPAPGAGGLLALAGGLVARRRRR